MIRITYTIIIFMLLPVWALFSQTFSATDLEIEQLGYSSAIWGDVDGDADLDIFISGKNDAEEKMSCLYLNMEGTFVLSNTDFIGLEDGHNTFGDFDNDNDLDILMTGNSGEGLTSVIYENIGDGNFELLNMQLTGVENGKSAWGDFDNDGDLDLILTGNWTVELYENIDDKLILSSQNFEPLNSSCADWGDYDNDGDLDLILTGDSGAGVVVRLYKNNNGVFEEQIISMNGAMAGKSGFVDYNNDMYTDIYISGFNDALEPVLYLYKNNGDATFTLEPNGITGTALTGMDWGDYDFDGDLDIVVTGKGAGCGLYIGRVYKNEGDYFLDAGAGIKSLTRGSAQWGDFDNDGDIDILMSGLEDDYNPETIIYRNEAGDNAYHENTNPLPPAGLLSEVNGDEVMLSWEGASDEQTLFLCLNYNIMVGTEPGSGDTKNPMADPGNGIRKIKGIGNSGQNLSSVLKNLEPGTYYWRVQSIDQAGMASAFSEEDSFDIIATSVSEQIVSDALFVFPNPVTDFLRFSGADQVSAIVIYNTKGERVLNHENVEREKSVDVSVLTPGIYFYQVTGFESTYSGSFIKADF